MNKIVQALIGGLIAVLGAVIMIAAVAVIVLAKTITIWSVVMVAVGAGVLFWGGVIVPNSGVEDGAHKLTVLVGPFIPLLPGGRRITDQPQAQVMTATVVTTAPTKGDI